VRENGKNVLKPNKVFATRIANREFRFHIGQYEDFIKFVSYEGLTPEYYEVVVKPMYTPALIKTSINPRFEERDYQTKIIEFLTSEEIGDNRSRLVGLQTGGGKGLCSLSSVSRLGTRTLVIVLPKYIQKWAIEISDVLGVKPNEIITIQGGEQLKSLMFLSVEQDIHAKFIIISLTTLQNLYNDFRDNGDGLLDMEFPYLPDELCERLKIGTIIFDEAHQHLYGVYRTLLHTHVPKVIALTATLISDDPFIDYMQHVMFPKEIRYNKVPINKYVKIKSYSYGFKNRDIVKRIRTSTRGSNTYNQIEFEKSLVRIPLLLKSYLDLIVRLVKLDYIDNRLEGDKAMVFAGSIDMCTRITERLKKEFPYLDVRRYVEDDPYENAIEADIRVSTVLSGGTAIDIPNLRTALMTNSIQSPVSNLQALGRLRQLKDRDVTFSYMVNFHIPKQVDYHNRKKELFADRAVSFKELRVDEGI
jgi:superfamily II DNA or RNA helicase